MFQSRRGHVLEQNFQFTRGNQWPVHKILTTDRQTVAVSQNISSETADLIIILSSNCISDSKIITGRPSHSAEIRSKVSFKDFKVSCTDRIQLRGTTEDDVKFSINTEQRRSLEQFLLKQFAGKVRVMTAVIKKLSSLQQKLDLVALFQFQS